ncbi:SusD/RagB family nutrient-binding outer membrane lipoprotein [Parabacteroides sp.]
MKRKNYIYTGVLALALGVSMVSCGDYLDINDNPNFPTEASLATLLPSAEITTIAQTGYNGALIGNMWMQYTTQGNTTNQYNTTVNYSITTASYNAFWTNAYANTLPDLKLLIEQAEAEGAWNFWLIGKVLMAYNYHILTDIYEDIPFTEALQAKEFPKPKYDDSRTVVYPGILALLDEAIAKQSEAADRGNPVLSTGDYYFNGKIDKWVAFAKSLKLKVMLRDFESYKSQISSLLSDGNLLEEDCAVTVFEDATNKGNPFYEYNIRQLNTRENIRASHTLLEFLLANEDPRIMELFLPTTVAQRRIDAGETLTYRETFEGLPQGTKPSSQAEDEESVPLVNSSRYKQAYDDPVYLMNKAECYFLIAEAYARLGNAAEAKTAYDKGVTAAFDRWGFDASSFISEGAPYAFKNTSAAEMLKCILTQKWVSYAKANSWDAWFDRNRTGIPSISKAFTVRVSNQKPGLTEGYELGTLVAPGSTVLQPMEFPRRMLIPDISAQYNENAPTTKALQEPMWWQVADGK